MSRRIPLHHIGCEISLEASTKILDIIRSIKESELFNGKKTGINDLLRQDEGRLKNQKQY